MTKELLIQLIINNLPAIVAVIGILYSIFKSLATVKTIFEKSDVTRLENQIKEANDEVKIIIQANYELQKRIDENMKENAELKKQLAEVLEKLAEPKEETAEEI